LTDWIGSKATDVSVLVGEVTEGEDGQAFVRMLTDMYDRWAGSTEGEEGLHRLVWRSPSDPRSRRMSVFARVAVDGRSSDEIVRSYILFPYKLVRDYRTGRESTEVERILAGELQLIKPASA
jgi:protein subunit release factor B